MKKLILSVAASAVLYCAQGQDHQANVKAMLDAENSFARMSKEQTTKKAFLQYLSDSSVMFDQSKPVKGRKSWEEKKENNALLFWWPVFAGVSNDGNLGFSTGPWEYAATKSDKPQYFGYYATVWEKMADGSWKMAADIGVSLPKAEENIPSLSISAPPSKATFKTGDDAKKDLYQHARQYDSRLNSANCSVLATYYAKDARLLRENQFPYINIETYQVEKDVRYIFTTTGVGMSSSNDLGYTYGTASSTIRENGADKNIHHYFMKVWKREGDEWKIVLDVLGGA